MRPTMVRLMLDFNQSQSTAGAVERIRRLQDVDLTRVEEPVAAELEGPPPSAPETWPPGGMQSHN